MTIHPLAGRDAPKSILIDPAEHTDAYYQNHPDMSEDSQRVVFGTSGHRGLAVRKSFNEDHVVAIAQAICDFRRENGISGPLFLGKDTHLLSEAAQKTCIEVLAGNGVEVYIQENDGFTPTPVISYAIIKHNAGKNEGTLADGIVVTPSHNPPDNGGIKYNYTNGGPADTHITQWIADRANRILESGNSDVKRTALRKAMSQPNIVPYDYISPYVEDLQNILDMDVIRRADLRICADALGGSGLDYYDAIAKRYGLNIDVKNNVYDPTFSFMTVDKDGLIRMDCSSPYAMARLIEQKDAYDITFGSDPDFDRHGIVTPTGGLMNPNHYLAAAIWYLIQHRPDWKADMEIGKTTLSSSMIDRVVESLGRRLYETPVGIKWFSDGLTNGHLSFCGEESAGGTFVRKNGRVWTTDKDGIVLSLLSAEITASTGKNPHEIYCMLEDKFGSPAYTRIDAPIDKDQKKRLLSVAPETIDVKDLAGEPIRNILTKAPGNNVSIGGMKIVTQNAWIAARPSGTEDIYRTYAESFLGKEHLEQVLEDGRRIIDRIIN
ncbi:MAG: alpha-D-glucose phosphate-specific phosphoglucomutase [Acidobacteria bacterium]|nr:alpha-D-glucose phosphate-specific phosphoglucomutase [Acidobacteriota bacterium]